MWAMRKLLVHPKHKILNWIWKSNLLPKIKIFFWLAIREALPICEFLITRRLEITNCGVSPKLPLIEVLMITKQRYWLLIELSDRLKLIKHQMKIFQA